jgi:carbonic anhydrase
VKRSDLKFTYAEQDKWKDQFPMFCSGIQQSPIDIHLDNCTQLAAGMDDLKFAGWSSIPSKTTLKKTVDTVQIFNEYSGAKPTVTGGPLGSDTFALYQAHFHWGATEQ